MATKKQNIISKIFNDKSIQDYVNVFPNRVGSQGFDAWGFNIKNMKNNMRLTKYLYEDFYKVETVGLENVPKEGRCLIIPNHSGQLPFDGLLVGYSLLTNPNGARAPKAMVERFLPTVPFIGNWLSSVGAVIGDPINCERMLDNEEAIIVFPEGVRGSNKLYKQRYQLQRFGSGFVHLAMNNNAPIIPVGIVGMEETIRSYADLKPLAKLLGMPVLPLVVPFIFPSKVFIYFGKPIYFNNDVHKESDIKERVDIVKAAIDDLLKQGLARREEYQRAQKEKNKKV
ncbi:MAG TPA: lysophospholipid acyltransferase family protein [Chitinophagales bacterium]|jgi:1-acyl-sn-glycerol-3-phosphate acyltransferase|nr:acyltransferase family protein [Chitinophagales bacterium]HOY40849.1 lysophospholipid acyltransferase family protein [Chitinophagales bacterium]HPH88348.1 lysophospholipid acyltransferase family protein [Chitinophagales bacterium]